jgi:predicted ester cyclase
MSFEANKKLLADAVARFSLETLDDYLNFYDPNAALHFLPAGMPQGRDGARLFYHAFLTAFPDARLTLDDVISEGDKAAARFTIEATHRGEFLGIPPNGKRVRSVA